MDPNDSKIVQNFKKMCKNIPILETYAVNKIRVQYPKSKKEKNSTNTTAEVLVKRNTTMPDGKRNP